MHRAWGRCYTRSKAPAALSSLTAAGITAQIVAQFRHTRRGPRGPNAAPAEVATSLAPAIVPAGAGTHGSSDPYRDLRSDAKRGPATDRRRLFAPRRRVECDAFGSAGAHGTVFSFVYQPQSLRAPGVLHA